jgi:hypothetical protein
VNLFIDDVFSDSSNRKIIGLLLTILALVFGLMTLHKGAFSDEADNLVVGNLILKGEILYRDIFSHHFPFPYYWMSIIIGLFGKSVFIARLSVLAFQFMVFVLAMRFSRNYVLVGITALLWSIIRTFYYGHMVLYSSFVGASLFLVLITVILVFQQRISPNWRHWLAIGTFSSIALLSDPLSIYAIAVMIILLFTKKPLWAINAGLVIGLGFSLYTGYLLISGNMRFFIDKAILFNSDIYSRYVFANPLRLDALLDMIIKGLGITNKIWFDLDPFKPITDSYTALDSWFFTGFLFRFSIILSAVFLGLRKQFRAAILIYMYAAATSIINPWGFRTQPFIMVSLMAISFLITDGLGFSGDSKSFKVFRVVVGVIVLLMTIWLCSRLMTCNYDNLMGRVESPLIRYERESNQIQEWACNHLNVLLANYPGGRYYYWFTDMKPVSQYTFMYPWVADVGLDEVIGALEHEETLAIVVINKSVIWGRYSTEDYLQPLKSFLEYDYYKVSDGVYVSPALHSRCWE